jgi:hypothetical protein
MKRKLKVIQVKKPRLENEPSPAFTGDIAVRNDVKLLKFTSRKDEDDWLSASEDENRKRK